MLYSSLWMRSSSSERSWKERGIARFLWASALRPGGSVPSGLKVSWILFRSNDHVRMVWYSTSLKCIRFCITEPSSDRSKLADASQLNSRVGSSWSTNQTSVRLDASSRTCRSCISSCGIVLCVVHSHFAYVLTQALTIFLLYRDCR